MSENWYSTCLRWLGQQKTKRSQQYHQKQPHLPNVWSPNDKWFQKWGRFYKQLNISSGVLKNCLTSLSQNIHVVKNIANWSLTYVVQQYVLRGRNDFVSYDLHFGAFWDTQYIGTKLRFFSLDYAYNCYFIDDFHILSGMQYWIIQKQILKLNSLGNDVRSCTLLSIIYLLSRKGRNRW